MQWTWAKAQCWRRFYGRVANVWFIAAGTVDYVPSIPIGIADKDILILASSGSLHAPTGWTIAVGPSNPTVYWKRTNGTESAPNMVDQMSVIAAFRGCIASGSPLAGISALATGTTSVTVPSLTTTADGSMVILVAQATVQDADSANIDTTSNPTGWARMLAGAGADNQGSGGGTSDVGIGLWYGSRPIAGPTGAEASTLVPSPPGSAFNYAAAMLLALKPEPATITDPLLFFGASP